MPTPCSENNAMVGKEQGSLGRSELGRAVGERDSEACTKPAVCLASSHDLQGTGEKSPLQMHAGEKEE